MGYRGVLATGVLVLAACGDNVHIASARAMLIVSPQADLRTTEGGGAAEVRVSLSEKPRDSITVELASMDLEEGTVSPATLTFSRDDYDQPKIAMLTGVDDARADGEASYLVRIDGASAGVVELEVVNEDDDTADILVLPLVGLMTTEGGTSAQFAMRLRSQPFANVTIPVASTDASEGVTNKTSLVFTEVSWATPQTVDVIGQQDAVVDGTTAYTIDVGAATSTDPAYDGLDPDDVEVQNVDDDSSGIAVVAPARLTTSEAGTQDTFTVVLQSQPAANVTIAVASTETSEASVSTNQLVFTPANWNQPQTVTVSGVDDAVDDGTRPFTVTLGAATSTDTSYAGIDPTDPAGDNSDNDTAAIVVTPTTGLTTSEAGAGDTFTVVLASQPTAPVTIALASTDSGEGVAAPGTLTFTAQNWNQARTITVTGVDDATFDGLQSYAIRLAPATSTDPLYDTRDAADVAVVNLDNDTTGITVEPSTGLLVSEYGDTDTFTIVLDSAPTRNVTIALSSSDTTEGTVSPPSLTFTPQNWSVPQTVTITGVSDTLVDGNRMFLVVTGAAVSSDPAYNGQPVADVTVWCVDDETAQVYVRAPRRLNVSENGQSATFRARLTLAPTAPVSCPVASNDATEGAVSPRLLVFQPASFDFTTVTVSGVDDTIDDGDRPFTVVLAACTSTDARYNGANPLDVAAINRDNE